MKNTPLSRRERQKQRQRREIISTALALFSEKGYHNVSMHEIAEKAEFAIGTLYKFFSNKEDLYKAIVTEQSEKFHETMDTALAAADDEIEQLQNYIRAKNTIFQENLAFVRLYVAESRGVSYNLKAGLDVEMREKYYDLLSKLAAVFETGMENRRFKKIADPYHLAVAFDSTIISFHLLWLDAPEKSAFPDNPDEILNIFFKGLINQ
jgi:AcrR family transcriptional regulator